MKKFVLVIAVLIFLALAVTGGLLTCGHASGGPQEFAQSKMEQMALEGIQGRLRLFEEGVGHVTTNRAALYELAYYFRALDRDYEQLVKDAGAARGVAVVQSGAVWRAVR